MPRKKSKENLTVSKAVRFTERNYNELDKSAQELDMPFNTYVQDILMEGNQRKLYAKRKMVTAIVTANRHIDQIYELLAATESDYISKESIINLLEEARKDCETL